MEHLTPIHGDDGAVREYRYHLSWCKCDGDTDDDDAVDKTWTVGLRELRSFFFHKTFLSSDLATGNFVTVLLHSPQWRLSYARGGTIAGHRCHRRRSGTLKTACVFKDELLYRCTRSISAALQ
jgi:hypothetical protein